jgi:Holliday junction resolvase RusA-like endonuclease
VTAPRLSLADAARQLSLEELLAAESAGLSLPRVMPWPPSLDPALTFVVPGDPHGQGSLLATKTGGVRYPTATINHRNAVVAELLDAWHGRDPITGPVQVIAELRFRRPESSHFLPANTRRRRPELRADAPEWHIVRPDTDKCARLLGDALEIAGVIADDKQIARWVIAKKYPAGLEPGSTTVAVYEL